MSLGGLIDVLGKRLDELTAIFPVSQAPLSGGHSRSTSVTNSLSLHCTVFKTCVALLGFLPSSTETQQGPREMPIPAQLTIPRISFVTLTPHT